jgi:hypothetical protein
MLDGFWKLEEARKHTFSQKLQKEQALLTTLF